MLPKTTRGGTVSATLQIRVRRREIAGWKNAVGSMTGALLMRGTKNQTRQQIQDEMVKLNARINVSGGVSGADASDPDHRGEPDSGAAPGGRDAARAGVPGSGIRPGEEAADRRDREPQDRTRRAGAAGARARLNPYPRNDVRYVGTIDEADRGYEQGHAGRREEVPRAVLWRVARRTGDRGPVRSSRGEQDRGGVVRHTGPAPRRISESRRTTRRPRR